MITVLLAIDGIAFLIVLAILSIFFIILSAVDDPSPQWSSIILMVSLALIALFTDAGKTAIEQPVKIALLLVGYCIIGCLYSVFIRWPLYLNGLRRRLVVLKADLLRQYNLAADTAITPAHKELFTGWMYAVNDLAHDSGLRLNSDGKLVPPQYYDNKARLSTWAILWPWNVLWVLVRKPIIWVFEELLSLEILKRVCQAMSNWMFKDFNK